MAPGLCETLRNHFHLDMLPHPSTKQYSLFGKIFILYSLDGVAILISWPNPWNRYLQMRSPRIRSKLLIPTIQSIVLLYALLCSISRITDNRHHWWDVLAGAKIGIIFSSLVVSLWFESVCIRLLKLTGNLLFQCIFLCKNFQTKKTVVEPIHQNGNTIDHRHASVRRLLSERTKDEVNLNHVVVP